MGRKKRAGKLSPMTRKDRQRKIDRNARRGRDVRRGGQRR